MKLLIKVSRSRLKIIKIFEENVRLKALALTRVTKGLKKSKRKIFFRWKKFIRYFRRKLSFNEEKKMIPKIARLTKKNPHQKE